MSKTKGSCVICGSIGNLTRDHVPPKGVMPAVDIEISGIWPSQVEKLPERVFQAPIFPTLCSKCNGKRLGEHYDPALIAFANGMINWLRWAKLFALPKAAATVDIQSSAVARAVVGHLLAAERRRNRLAPPPKGAMLEAMRRFFLGEDVVPELRIFVWPYMGDVVIARSFANMGVVPATNGLVQTTHEPIIGDVLKFFPVAFWVTWKLSDKTQVRLAEIPISDDSITQIKIPLFNLPPPYWPEQPLSHEAVASGDTTGLTGKAIPKPPQRRSR